MLVYFVLTMIAFAIYGGITAYYRKEDQRRKAQSRLRRRMRDVEVRKELGLPPSRRTRRMRDRRR